MSAYSGRLRRMAGNLVKQAACAALALSVSACATGTLHTAPAGSGIVRIAKTPPTPTLDAVLLPPGCVVLTLSGQTPSPLDPAKYNGPDDFGDTRTQTLNVFTKIKALLEKQGFGMQDIVKLTVFLAGEPQLGGKADFAGMNEVYEKFFGTAENPNRPARSAMQVVALARPGYRVEIEAIAAKVPAK